MSTTISSIRSVLIRTCMANIQKEVSQLEHWLNNLSIDEPIPSKSTHSYDEQFELSNMNRVIERVAEEIGNQRNTLDNILERVDRLEGFHRTTREVFIDEKEKPNTNLNDPWLDNICEPLENEIVNNEDDISEPLYSIYKKSLSTESSVGTPSIIPDIPDDRSVIPDIDSDDNNDDDEKVSMPPTLIQLNRTKKPEIKAEEKEVVIESTEVNVKEVEEVEEEEEEVEEEEEEVEEEVEEEEEEGIELDQIEYKGVNYYKDPENFIYSITDTDEPSENPVGYWKEKTNTIAFYKTK